MKKIHLFSFFAILTFILNAQPAIPFYPTTQFNPYNRLYLSDVNVVNFPCSNSYSNSIADDNILSTSPTLNTSLIGMSQNIYNANDPLVPKGIFRLVNLNPPFNSFSFPTEFSRYQTQYNVISLNNSTQTGNEYLLSGTHYKTALTGNVGVINNFSSRGVIGLTDLLNSQIRYYYINAIGLTHSVSWYQPNITTQTNVDIVDAVRDASNNIYGLGVVVNNLGNVGAMFVTVINSANTTVAMYRFRDGSGQLLENVLPYKIFIDNNSNKLYIIGRTMTIVPSGTNFTSPFLCEIDLNTHATKFHKFSYHGTFFDMKMHPNGNYILGCQEDHSHYYGFIEIDNNMNIVREGFWQGNGFLSASNIKLFPGFGNFGNIKYSSLNVVNSDNIQFYGWNDYGMAFANVNIGQPNTYAGSPSAFYGIVLGKDYSNLGSATPLPEMLYYHSNISPNFKFQEINGMHPSCRKLMLNNQFNGFNFYMSNRDVMNCRPSIPTLDRMDKLLSRMNPITVNYNTMVGSLQSNFLQFINSNTTNPSTGGYQEYEGLYNTCTGLFPIDYYASPLNNVNVSITETYDNICLECQYTEVDIESSQNDIVEIEDAPLKIEYDNVSDCNISDNVQYFQKGAFSYSNKEKILSIELFDLLGRNLKFDSKEFIQAVFNEDALKSINSQIKSNNHIVIVNITTDKQVVKYKIKKE